MMTIKIKPRITVKTDNLPIPSKEQELIIESVKKGVNVCINAVAGAGKTTTLCMIAHNLPRRKCQLITYSRALKDDIAAKHIPENITVHTFHGYASVCYKQLVNNDELFKNCINTGPPPINQIDTLMIDEVQDMTPLYFMLIKYVIDANPNIQLILVGDPRQTIREYVGARSEFILNPETIFHQHTTLAGNWERHLLTVSYRLTPFNAEFVNTHLYNQQVIIGGNTKSPNIKPTYVALNSAFDFDVMLKIIHQMCTKYGHEHVQILVPSVKASNSPARKLASAMIKIPHYICADGEIPNPKIIAGKLIFRTFASCKGLQSKCIFLLGLDETYYHYFDKNWNNKFKVSNILTVVATRAIDALIIFALADQTLRTIIPWSLTTHVDLMGKLKDKKILATENKELNKPVTDFIKHKHPDIIEQALNLLKIKMVQEGTQYKLPPATIDFTSLKYGKISEPVSQWYGLLIPKLMEAQRHKTHLKYTLPNLTDENIKQLPLGVWNKCKNTADNAAATLPELMAAEIITTSTAEEHYHIQRQIDNFEWVAENVINDSITILDNLLPKHGSFEANMPKIKILNINLSGRADFMTEDEIFELKYSDTGKIEHFIQLGCYLAMNGKGSRGGRGKGKLIIYPCGEIYEVTLDLQDAEKYLLIIASDSRTMLPISDVIRNYKHKLHNSDDSNDRRQGV